MTGRANANQLDALHGLLAGALKSELEAALKRAKPKDEGGEGTPVSPQLLDKVLAFLKANGVDSPAKNRGVSALEDVLRNADVDLDEAAMGGSLN